MWQLLRPDAESALEDPVVKSKLARYVKVVKNELPAKFQIAKRVPAKKKSWEEHENAMKKFRELQEKIDRSRLRLESLKLPKQSLLDLKIFLTKDVMKNCELCEHKCKVNRMRGNVGFCAVDDCLISSEFIHMGEESYYVPSHTVFFWSCNMQCAFCQNYTISSRLEPPLKLTPKNLAEIIEKRREQGCRNCNLVGGEPTPYILWILQALKLCKSNVPIVWNSNMYMSEKAMKILDGIVDVYLTDFKFGPSGCAERLTKVKNYWEVVTRNHLLACQQTEVTVRHLILPNHVDCCSLPIVEWIARNIKDKCIFNPMAQYYPCFLAKNHPEICRRITPEEYETVVEKARKATLNIRG